jgi:hypothetical protein
MLLFFPCPLSLSFFPVYLVSLSFLECLVLFRFSLMSPDLSGAQSWVFHSVVKQAATSVSNRSRQTNIYYNIIE